MSNEINRMVTINIHTTDYHCIIVGINKIEALNLLWNTGFIIYLLWNYYEIHYEIKNIIIFCPMLYDFVTSAPGSEFVLVKKTF